MSAIQATARLNLLAAAEVGSGGTSAWQLETAWSWAPWATLLLVAFCVGWVAYFYARESPTASPGLRALLASMRIMAIGLVMMMIAELALSVEQTGRPSLVLIVDESASMSIVDQYDDVNLRETLVNRLQQSGLDQPSRLNLARLVLLDDNAALLSKLQQDYRLHTYALSDAARALPVDPAELTTRLLSGQATGSSSRLGEGVRRVLSDLRSRPPAAVLLLTDGVTTDGTSLSTAAEIAARRGVPIFAVGLGSDQPSRDVALSELLVDEVVFLNDVVNFTFTVTAYGLEDEEVEITLRRADRPQPLAAVKVTLPADGAPTPVRLPYRPDEVGQHEYVIEVAALDDEVQTDNNRLSRIVDVRDQKIRVLLAASQPSYEFRYLKTLLERDPTIELRTVLQDADVEYSEIDPTALPLIPVRREELFSYDVLLFADVDPKRLTSGVMENIQAFVSQRGGGLVFISGPQFVPLAYQETPLAALFPIDISAASIDDVARDGFQIQPTELGLASPHMHMGETVAETARIWDRLPSMHWLVRASRVKPAGRVLAQHPTLTDDHGQPYPIFCLQYVGAGQVLFHAIDGTWRWRFRVGDVYLSRYWVQTIRMLARAKLIGDDRAAQVTADRREYRRGESARLRVRFADLRAAPSNEQEVELIVEADGQNTRRLRLEQKASNRGVFEGTLTGLATGAYRVWLASADSTATAPSTSFVVTAPVAEFEQPAADFRELVAAAELTGGRFYTITSVDRLLDELPVARPVPIDTLPPVFLWNQWWFLLAFLTLLICEWLLRKRKGLI